MSTPESSRQKSKDRRSKRRTASQRLLRAKAIEIGSNVWIEDPVEIWTLVQVISQDNTIVQGTKVDGSIVQIDLGFQEVFPANMRPTPDMTSLAFISEPTILQNLSDRFLSPNLQAYTYMGTILIAVNPLRPIPDPAISLYHGQPTNFETPHPFAIAETAYQQMRFILASPVSPSQGGPTVVHHHHRASQSIVISGESGAGKTETAKIVLHYLTQVLSHEDNSSISRKLLNSSPIFESFGNARTNRNNNSSRFGKFMKLHYNEGNLVGCSIETYLLEKSRLVFLNSGEGNFHVMYYIPNIVWTDFHYLNQGMKSSEYSCMSSFWEVEKSKLMSALSSFELDADSLFGVLTGLLYLGNVKFEEKDTTEGGVASICPESLPFLTSAAVFLFGSSVSDRAVNNLSRLMTERRMTTRGEVFFIPLSVADAYYCRDALAKAIYDCLFAYVVDTINQKLGLVTSHQLPFIGVLDIFGFESFERNDLEQLCINYANETLQKTFNEHVFKAEIELYNDENIECHVSSYPDNSECVELLAGKPDGVFLVLDAICRQPKPTDDKFCSELHSRYAKGNHFFPKPHPKDIRDCFIVRHFAGRVRYNVVLASSGSEKSSWIMKNNDAIPDGIAEVLSDGNIGNPLVSLLAMMTSGLNVSDAQSALKSQSYIEKKGSALNKPTISLGFCRSMDLLNQTLRATRCSFIRCIKPNLSMSPGVFDRKFATEQLRSLGLLQTCEVLQVGLPTRLSYVDLLSSLPAMVMQTVSDLFVGQPEQVTIASVLWAFEVPPETYRLGRTRIFFRAGQLARLERILKGNMNEIGNEHIIARLQIALENRQAAKRLVDECEQKIDLAQKKISKSQDVLKSVQESVARDKISFNASSIAMKVGEIDFAIKKAEADFGCGIAGNARSAMLTRLSNAETEADASSVMEEALRCLLTADRLMSTVIKTKAAQMFASLSSARNDDAEENLIDSWDKVSNMEAQMKQLDVLFREAQDGAFRCQLDYTQDRYDQMELRLTYIDEKSVEVEVTLVEDIHDAVDHCRDMWRQTNEIADEIKFKLLDESHGDESFLQLIRLANAKAVQAEGIANAAKLERARREEEERRRRAEEEERNRIAEEKRKLKEAEDRRRREEEERRRVEEEERRHRAEVERRQVEEEQRIKREEEERKRREEEERRFRELDDQKRREEEIRRNEALEVERRHREQEERERREMEQLKRLKEEEHKRRLEEETRRAEEEQCKQREEDERKRRKQDELKRLQEEESERLKAERLRTVPVVDTVSQQAHEAEGRKLRDLLKNNSKLQESQAPVAEVEKPADNRRGSMRMSQTSVSAIPTFEEEEDVKPSKLPSGWEEFYDENYKLPYYLNLVTGTTQWEKPLTSATSSDVPQMPVQQVNPLFAGATHISAITEDEEENERPSEAQLVVLGAVERQNPLSLLASLSSSKATTTQQHMDVNDNSTTSFNRPVIPSRKGRGDNTLKLRINKFSTAQADAMGGDKREGFLMKQSKYLGRWKSRYFVLEDNTLQYYEKKADAGNKTLGRRTSSLAPTDSNVSEDPSTKKCLLLTSSTVTSYTDTANCFSIRCGDEIWFLVARDDQEMQDWIIAINAHVRAVGSGKTAEAYDVSHEVSTASRPSSQATQPDSDAYWNQGSIGTSFFRCVRSLEAPVGIRTTPDVTGPRTGQGIFPGEVIEVVQVIEKLASVGSSTSNTGSSAGFANLRFLRLSDDRGWVFERHPLKLVPGKKDQPYSSVLFEQVMGDLVIENEIYQLPADITAPVGIRYGPGKDSQQTGEGVFGGECIRSSKRWIPSPTSRLSTESGVEAKPHRSSIFGFGGSKKATPVSHDDDAAVGGEDDGQQYIRLADGRGWIFLRHPDSKQTLFVHVRKAR